MLRIAALVVLFLLMIGLAYRIEAMARPETNRQGVHVPGGHDH